MQKELQEILRDAYLRERRLNLLYATLAEMEEDKSDGNGLFLKAKEDQDGDLQALMEINRKYGNDDIDPNVLEKMAESLLHLRSNLKEREELVRLVLEAETQLVEVYKKSLRYLLADDLSRKLINRILTVKLVHKRDLMDSLRMFTSG